MIYLLNIFLMMIFFMAFWLVRCFDECLNQTTSRRTADGRTDRRVNTLVCGGWQTTTPGWSVVRLLACMFATQRLNGEILVQENL